MRRETACGQGAGETTVDGGVKGAGFFLVERKKSPWPVSTNSLTSPFGLCTLKHPPSVLSYVTRWYLRTSDNDKMLAIPEGLYQTSPGYPRHPGARDTHVTMDHHLPVHFTNVPKEGGITKNIHGRLVVEGESNHVEGITGSPASR